MEVEAWGVSAAANVPPAVAITSPVEGASFVAPADIRSSWPRRDSDGIVQQVDFFVDGALSRLGHVGAVQLHVDDCASWARTRDRGRHRQPGRDDNVGAGARDGGAANAPPTVAITSPANGAAFTAPATSP